MTTVSRLGVAITRFLLFGVFALIFGEKSFDAALWGMVAVLWLSFIWFVWTVVARRVGRKGDAKRSAKSDAA